MIPNYSIENALRNFGYDIDDENGWGLWIAINDGNIIEKKLNKSTLYTANTSTIGGLKVSIVHEDDYIYLWYDSYPTKYMITNNENYKISSIYKQANEIVHDGENDFTEIYNETYILGKNGYTYKDKMLYIKSLDYINNYVNSNYIHIYDYTTNSLYKYWDMELNRIYELLKFKLSKEEFSNLQLEQKDWLQKKNNLEMYLKDNYLLNDDYENYFINSSLSEFTKVRTMELINKCFDSDHFVN